jgi:microcystin degradation protein MlrC
VDHAFFEKLMAEWQAGLRLLRGQVDGVFCVMHGAGLTTVLDDPEGAVQALVRAELGELPFICSYDLHANVSDANVALNDAYVGYLTNPHMDMRERGAESAQLMRRLLAGERFVRAHRRLPIVAPTVSLLTAQGPYAEVINLGQERRAADPRIANVSVMAGFAYGDTPFNGMTAVVTGTHQGAVDRLADELADAAWARRDRFVARLTSLEEATERALTSETPLAFADVADNPGGGGSGNTMWLLESFHRAGRAGRRLRRDPRSGAGRRCAWPGRGKTFEARFNRAAEQDPFRRPFAAEAKVMALSDGKVTGRRGIFAGTAMHSATPPGSRSTASPSSSSASARNARTRLSSSISASTWARPAPWW